MLTSIEVVLPYWKMPDGKSEIMNVKAYLVDLPDAAEVVSLTTGKTGATKGPYKDADGNIQTGHNAYMYIINT